MATGRAEILGLPREDIERVLQRLKLSLLHAINSTNLHPVIRIGSKIIKGFPLRDSNFKTLPPIKVSPPRVLAIDSSIKCLLDIGAFKIYLVKIALLVFERHQCDIIMHTFRLITTNNKREGLRQALFIENSLARKAIISYKPSLLLLDQSLTEPPERPRGLRILLRTALKHSVTIVGISKSSSMMLEDGSSLLGYLKIRASILGYDTWYYHPLFSLEAHNSLLLGEIVIAKLSPWTHYVFRIDVFDPNNAKIDEILARIIALEDSAIPGYPYPLVQAHREARITIRELQIAKGIISSSPLIRNLTECDLSAFRRLDLEGRSSSMGRGK